MRENQNSLDLQIGGSVKPILKIMFLDQKYVDERENEGDMAPKVQHRIGNYSEMFKSFTLDSVKNMPA